MSNQGQQLTTKLFNLEPADVFVGLPYPKPRWLWEGQIAEGCVTLLVGPPKAGKSLFARNLLREITRGNSFLGRQTKMTSVAYFALEEHASFLQKSLKDAGMDNQFIHVHCGPLLETDTTKTLEQLEEYCLTYGIKLVVIDPLAKFVNINDTNDYSKVYKQLSEISHFARKQNIHILLVHHSNKGSSGNTNQILGSTGFFGVSDGAFLLSKEENRGKLQSHLRYGDSLEPCVFEYDSNKVLIFKGTSSDLSEKELLHRVLDYLIDNPDSLTADIQEGLGLKREYVFTTLEKLLKSQQIVKFGEGTKGKPYKYSVPDIENQSQEQNNEAGHE